MARPDKATAVAEITQAFRDSSAAVLTEYRGLTVAELTELRRALGAGTKYAIVKNTLTKIAAREAGLDGLDALLEGPTAIAFVTGDPVEAAKGVRDFARTHPLLVVKGGVLDGRAMAADEVRRLADLESREVLLAKLAGAMLASLSQAVYLLNAPLAQVARLAAALRDKAEQDPTVLQGEISSATVSAEDAAPVADGAPTDSAPTDDAAAVAEAAAQSDAAPDEATAETAADATPETAADDSAADDSAADDSAS